MKLDAPINILSNSIMKDTIGGVKKVVANTTKGLCLIEQPFVLNKQIEKYKYNWVHDSVEAMIDIALLKRTALIGPNVMQIPSAFPKLMPSFLGCIYLIHSNWHKQAWDQLSKKNPIPAMIWPAGIDIDSFLPIRAERTLNKRKVLVYFKGRKRDTYDYVLQLLSSLDLDITIIVCGNYVEDQFKKALRENSFCIWVGIPETQGIAMQEAMATGMPIIVLDSRSPFEDTVGKSLKYYPKSIETIISTSAPYFDNTCGLIIDSVAELAGAISAVMTNYERYDPAAYVIRNLSLSKSAQMLIDFFHKLEIGGNYDNSALENYRPSLLAKTIYVEYLLKRKFKSLNFLINQALNA